MGCGLGVVDGLELSSAFSKRLLAMPLKLQGFVRSGKLWQYDFRYLRDRERAAAAVWSILGVETPDNHEGRMEVVVC